MATFEQAMKKMFKIGETYTGIITAHSPELLVKFTNGGYGLIDLNLIGLIPLETEVEIMIVGFYKSAIPFLILTADCCNRLKIPVSTKIGLVDAKSNSAIVIKTPDNNFITYMPYIMTYEYERVALKDTIRVAEMIHLDIVRLSIEEENSYIYTWLEKIVPVPEGLEIDLEVCIEAEKYASLLHRNGLHLGATYTGMATNNKGLIDKVWVDIIKGSVELLSYNVKLKIVNIPPTGNRAIEAILINK